VHSEAGINPETAAILVTPKNMLTKRRFATTHLRFNYEFSQGDRIEKRLDKIKVDEDALINNNFEVEVESIKLNDGIEDFDDSLIYRGIDGNVFVSPRSIQAPIQGFQDEAVTNVDINLDNQSFSNTFNYIHYVNATGHPGGYKYVSVLTDNRPYGSLQALVYNPTHHNPKDLSDTSTIFGGDTYITELQISDIDTISGSRFVYIDHLLRAWLESTIPFALRYGGNGCNNIYTSGQEGIEVGEYRSYVASKLGDGDPDEGIAPRDTICEEYYNYNPDYSKLDDEKPYFSLPKTFDYCSNCITSFPYRTRYSDQSYQEESIDNYRVFRANNYFDLDGSTGPINSLIVDKDELYVLTSKAPWFIPTNTQQIQSDESTIYLGTGERFSIPPRRLISSNYPYGGTQDTLSIISTEFGTVYVDANTGKIFHLSSQLSEISNKGMRNWFEKNLPSTLKKKVKEIGLDYNLPPTHKNGVGIMSVYDPRHRRIIIHKKDYSPRQTISRKFEPNALTLVEDKWRTYIGNEIEVTNPRYFENKSWTISYSFPHQSWVSFHSYLPLFMFNDESTFFTQNESETWEHNSGNYQNYYGTKEDHIIEFIANPQPHLTKVFQAMEIASTSQTWNENYGQWEDTDWTFDRGVFFTTHDSTGLQRIIPVPESNPFTTIFPSTTTIWATVTDDQIQLSNLSNYVIQNGPLFSSNWNDIRSAYPVDKVPHPTNINPDKSLYNANRLRGEWMGVRLYANPGNNLKMTTDLITTHNKYSYR